MHVNQMSPFPAAGTGPPTRRGGGPGKKAGRAAEPLRSLSKTMQALEISLRGSEGLGFLGLRFLGLR